MSSDDEFVCRTNTTQLFINENEAHKLGHNEGRYVGRKCVYVLLKYWERIEYANDMQEELDECMYVIINILLWWMIAIYMY